MGKFSKIHIAIFILLLFYTVGLVGLSLSEWRSLFLFLTSINVLLTLLVLIWANESNTFSTLYAALLVFVLGYLVELVGVKTGMLFGVYWYGASLGFKLFDVPLIIGVNWLILVFGANALFQPILKNKLLLSFAAALLMVILDIVIEPVAISLDFWQWHENIVPIQNFIMWFITSLILQLIVSFFTLKLKWQLGLLLYTVQFLFFGLLNLFLHL